MLRAQINSVAGGYGTIANAAIWQKVAAYGLSGLVVDAREATKADCDYVHGRSIDYGIIRDPTWTPGITAEELAATMHEDLLRALGGLVSGQCVAIGDIERHDPGDLFVLPWLRAIRKLRPTRALVWTMEPMQGGWFSKALVDAINADDHLWLAHQNYGGATTPLRPFAADVVRDDLLRAGIRREKLLGYYDATVPQANWNGYLFTLARLPSPSLAHEPLRLASKYGRRLLARSA